MSTDGTLFKGYDCSSNCLFKIQTNCPDSPTRHALNANELVVVVLVSLVPLVFPIAFMFLGLFTSTIQALIFVTLAVTYIGESIKGHH